MSNKKHIDRVFQEKLKDFEVSPRSKVWQNIKGELEQSDDNRKVFPIWLRMAGVAALLLILLTIGNTVISDTSNSNNDTIVDTENILNPPINQTNNINNNNDIDELEQASQEATLTNVDALDLNSAADNDASKNTNVTISESSKLGTNLLNNKAAVADSKTSEMNGVSEDKSTNYTTTSKSKKSDEDAVSQRNTLNATNQITQAVTQNKTLLNTSAEKENKGKIINGYNNSNDSSSPKIAERVAQNKAPINASSEDTNKTAAPNNSIIKNSSSPVVISERVAQNNSENQHSVSLINCEGNVNQPMWRWVEPILL